MYYQDYGKFLSAIFLKGNEVSNFTAGFHSCYHLDHQSPVEGYRCQKLVDMIFIWLKS